MYDILNYLGQSNSVEFADFVRRLELDGRSIIKLQTGDPDFPTHPAVVRAAYESMARGETKYSDSKGQLQLRNLLAEKLRLENHIEADPTRNILVTHGAVHAINIAIRALVNPGDEVIIVEPFWRPYQSVTLLHGAHCVIVSSDPESGFGLQHETVLDKITSKTKLVIINTPNNPSGAVYSEVELRLLASALSARGIYLLCDEVYEKIIFGNLHHYSPASDSDVFEHIISIFSFSKSHAMTGWRIGYVVAHHPLIDQMLKLSQYSITSLSPFNQMGAVAALTDLEAKEYSVQMCKIYETRKNLIETLIVGSWLEECLILPQGTFYALIKTDRFDLPSFDVAMNLVNRHNLSLTPGKAFGDSMDSYLRLCFATSEENIIKAFDTLKIL